MRQPILQHPKDPRRGNPEPESLVNELELRLTVDVTALLHAPPHVRVAKSSALACGSLRGVHVPASTAPCLASNHEQTAPRPPPVFMHEMNRHQIWQYESFTFQFKIIAFRTTCTHLARPFGHLRCPAIAQRLAVLLSLSSALHVSRARPSPPPARAPPHAASPQACPPAGAPPPSRAAASAAAAASAFAVASTFRAVTRFATLPCHMRKPLDSAMFCMRLVISTSVWRRTSPTDPARPRRCQC